MTRTQALFAASLLLGTVAACGQASEPSDTPETLVASNAPETAFEDQAEASPDSEEADIVEVASEAGDAPDAVAATEMDDHDHGETHDHAHDDEHDHGEDHAHDHDAEHDHDHDEAHSHDHDHDHAHDDDDHRHGGEAHVHGAAEFVLATTDTGAEAEFQSPLFNLVGFEHEPQTPEQTQAMADLVAQLAEASVVFVPSANAGCSTIDSMINVERNGDHSALTASYLMTCSDPSAIESIELTAFSTYANIESIDVVFVSNADQSAGTATADSPTFAIGG